LWAWSSFTFLLTRALPATPLLISPGLPRRREAIEQIRVNLGLDKAADRAVRPLRGDLTRGDLGNSLTTGQPLARKSENACPLPPN